MKKAIIIYFTVISVSFYLVFLGFFSSLDYNVNTPNVAIKQLFNLSAPEGWGFFTRSPREDIVDIYSIEDDKLDKVMQKNGHYSNLFGISRKSRKIGMETSIILGKVSDSMWTNKTDIGNIEIPSKGYTVSNEFLHYLKSGDYVLVKRKTIPWAWRKNINEKNVPYEITHVKIAAA